MVKVSVLLWLRRTDLISKLRGYLIVVFGLMLVTRVLREFVGTVPEIPSKITYGLLALIMLLALLSYRQTIAFLRYHELKNREQAHQRQAQGATAIETETTNSENTRIAKERHWRSQRATFWAVTASLFLMSYLFGMMVVVRNANMQGSPDGVDVVVPLVLPPDTIENIEGIRATGSNEPIDDILSGDAGYFAEFFPSEHPGYIYGTVIPLYILYGIFCMTLTRSCAYLVAPNPQRIQPRPKPGQEVTPKPVDTDGKDGPDGTDGVDLVLELLDEFGA